MRIICTSKSPEIGCKVFIKVATHYWRNRDSLHDTDMEKEIDTMVED